MILNLSLAFPLRPFGVRSAVPPWDSTAPIREELFGIERLELHAQSLATAQPVTVSPRRVRSLRSRLSENATALLAAYRANAAELESGAEVAPAAEWLLDNYHIVEEQIREIRDDLSPGYYRQLPKLSEGPFAGYPRVFGVTWAFVAHTDSYLDPDILRRFIAAYQRVQPLTIGELWAVAITLRIVLVENLRRLTGQITAGRVARADADALAGRLLTTGGASAALEADIALRASTPLSEVFAAQLARRLRDQDPRTTPALGWLELRLRLQGTSIDEVVLHAQQRQGASNVTVRNIITSMRLISDIDWAEWFESVSLVDARLRAGSAFAKMDFPTRNLYRSAIEQLAGSASCPELRVVELALSSTPGPCASDDAAEAERRRDPGYHLIGPGRRALERAIGFRAPPRLWISRCSKHLGLGGYVGALSLVTVGLLAFALWMLPAASLAPGWLVLLALIWIVPASEIAATLVNRALAGRLNATILPGLELKAGVPPSLRTLVVVPTLLTGEADLCEQIERLEVHHLAGAGGDLTFALLTDGVDADQEVKPGDAHLLTVASTAIARLNQRHGPGPTGDRFLLLHRRRLFNAVQGRWMGWERKRGKLHELNRLLRGASDTSYVTIDGQAPQVPAGVRYVITLDADTRLPRDAALRLIGKMSHPLNRPRFDAARQRIVGGYGILQPRVTPSLPIGREGSLFQRVFSGPGGIDPYAAAASDVYQDLFGEGSFTGKGIYDVDAFEAALSGRVPENTLLSHDLFEGVFARAGLASDVEVVEEFPARYDVVARRQHRWTRGDWQLLGWIFGRHKGIHAVPAIGRWKMLDNLRRSLLAPLLFASLVLCWFLPWPAGPLGTILPLSALAIPAALPGILSGMLHRSGIRLRNHVQALLADLRLAATQILLGLAFVPDQAWRTGDAIARTLARLFYTHRYLLEWTTAAQSATRPRLDLAGFYRLMVGGTLLALSMAAVGVGLLSSSWPLVLPFALLWLTAPALALWTSRAPAFGRQLTLPETDALALRITARRTWRFFETFVTPADNMLPPDNFQETPRPVVAHRTSPTNIGLYLLSAIAARDFGWAGTAATVARMEAAFAAMRKLPRYRGHFHNWYETQGLQALHPAYISSVDSGNLAAHLIVVANACEQWAIAPAPDPCHGLSDTARLADDALAALPLAQSGPGRQLRGLLAKIDTVLAGSFTMATRATETPELLRLTEKITQLVHDIQRATGDDSIADLAFWTDALQRAVTEHERDQRQQAEAPQALAGRLRALAHTARELALAMDFAFLLDPARKLLSIGYSLADNRHDASCYDLLASEARLASLFAIAKGDVSTSHWFRLGRMATPLGKGSALISWSGSMFEYLMPSLVMRAPAGSLLEQTACLVVARQRDYGQSLGIPWGVSESAYNARDKEFTYQYSNFGVPGLGLKRGLSENAVIAPYATGLAAMVDPQAARDNYRRLAELGALGRYGFYEALDYTRARLAESETVAIVRSFMAHHQGMTIVAIANALHNGRMRERFHREPMIQACELLLQERMPRNVAVAHPRAEEVKASTATVLAQDSAVRRFAAPACGNPVTHLLSNGRYAVMLTTTGMGYSRWRDLAVTRWREDATRDDSGSFIFLRDTQSGVTWSASARTGTDGEHAGEVAFAEDCAEFVRHDGSLTTILEVLVSGEDDGEVRRVSLVNNGRRSREIELTSYAEVALATRASYDAHPAFSRMFIQTAHLPESGALIATRRLRSPGESPVWAAHFSVVEGDLVADPQYESDRGRFLEDGRAPVACAVVTAGLPLSSTVGTVLDPIFSLRQRVRIAPGDSARVAFWTVIASSHAELLALIDKHQDRNAFDRAKTLAWTQAQVELRHLDVDAAEAADFQRLAAPLLYADARFRAPPDAILRGAGPQSGLWPLAISGDLPIVLMRIDEIEDIVQVRQLLRAHEYWRMKGLGVDLVIVNERASSYIQDLQIAIETAVRSSHSQRQTGEESVRGSVYSLRADMMAPEARTLLQSVARVALIARRGPIANQLARLPAFRAPLSVPVLRRRPAPQSAPSASSVPGLEFFNGLGGFDQDGQEYVVVLNAGQSTPAPWINVIANPGFGFQASASGSGYTWAENSRDNQLTPWSNDAATDPCGEAIYVRDEDTHKIWSATAQPIRDNGTYMARHGHGYSRFTHEANEIALALLQYVALDDPIKISRLTLRNLSGTPRRLSVTAYTEWVLGTSRSASAPFITTAPDPTTGALLIRNPWSTAFAGRVAFADLRGKQTAWTANRAEFLGRNGGPEAPAALLGEVPLSGATGAGLDPCTALQCHVELAAGETVEIVSFIGQCASAAEASALVARYRKTDLDVALAAVTRYWRDLLGAVQVRTPDRAMDIMLNGWLLYQTLACRIWARSAFYQASGAYGFRDQLQDGLALALASPDAVRRHLLRAAGRQFAEGDVQHWWLPHSGQGVRTRISDDRVWLAFATASYIAGSNDTEVLDEMLPFLEGHLLDPAEADAFFRPMVSDASASLFEHCARGIDSCMALSGEHGLPLIGGGDWNDGMNLVGAGGKGESVWLGWLLLRTLVMFAPLAQSRDAGRASRWRAHAALLREALEREAWDGDWYRRATFDEGTWLGSKDSEECRIDAIAQSWAVLSGAADPVRARAAMASLDKYLVRREDGLALLFTPPFDKGTLDPGYIKGYPPGLRENGGQYSHAAMWAVLAFARLGEANKAVELLSLLNPINHALTPAAVERYKVEPYVVAADVYSVPPHIGRGGWTWYTGAAGWMYRAALEGILGIRREGDRLIVAPCIPASWPGFKATINVASTHYEISVETRLHHADGISRALLDGAGIPFANGLVSAPLGGGEHTLVVLL
ncbi:GH36-type glycosyl hydrolase domain-containing protein [Cupriavidus pauculus]|uniref:Glycosyl transferase n=1 Tax=Cupriavidus pauculus TaxID=82633 RepID=A0A2N5C755_9BURK|nr:glucoamylase family protein [Cupriavidus pauculus]PLP98020.1 glycosyl transferase [Cupriavidus pauculus]